jgi:KUP system potassium uptake protein
VRQTSEESAGQVYVPQVNWLLAALVLALVFGFRSSDALADAYGIAVAGDMMVTTLLVTVVAYALWRWPAVLVFPVAGLFFLLDLTFVSANVHKIPAGGWFPLLVGFIALTLMLVWRKGRRVAFEQRDRNAIELTTFIASLDQPGAPERMNGTAVYLTKETNIVPAALELNVRHNGIVHKHLPASGCFGWCLALRRSLMFQPPFVCIPRRSDVILMRRLSSLDARPRFPR